MTQQTDAEFIAELKAQAVRREPTVFPTSPIVLHLIKMVEERERERDEWYARAGEAQVERDAAREERDEAIAERDWIERNRDMWKGQSNRQADELRKLRERDAERNRLALTVRDLPSELAGFPFFNVESS